MKRIIISLFSAATLAASATAPLTSASEQKAALQWADSVMNTMTLEQRAAQLFVPCINPKGGATSDALVKKWLVKDGMGGVLMSKGTFEEYARLINLSREGSKVAPMITFDGEWGLAMRIEGVDRFPQNMALGAIRDTELLKEYGLEAGREMRLLGINVNFAPVLDVNVNPANPVIGSRSFGENPMRVARDGAAYSAGLEEAGIMAVGKHFPGHGDTSVDSHKALATVSHSMAELEKTDLLPFEKFISEGGSGVMTGHLNVPAVDSSGTPASLSKKITTDLLRKQMGFKGLIFTDALAMKGAASKKNNCVEALKAGADMLVNPISPVNDLKAVTAAVKKGEISEASINEKCRRVLAYKYAMGLNRPAKINIAEVKDEILSQQSEAMNQTLANASMTLVKDPKNLVPMKNLDKNSIAVVNLGGTGAEFSRYCKKYDNDVKVYNGVADIKAIRKHDIVIAAIHSDNQAVRSGLAALHKVKNLVEVFFISPYKAAKYSASVTPEASLLMAYEDLPSTERAAAMALFGGIKVNGTLPVGIKGIAKAGDGLVREKNRLGYTNPYAKGMNPILTFKIDSIINSAVDGSALPGAEIVVVKDGDVVIDRAYGKQSMHGRVPVTESTLYDLASVSKATGTLSGVMKAYDLGLFDLEAKASDYIPGLKGTNKEDIKVIELLFHESGIQPSLNVFNVIIDSTSYEGKLFENKPTKSNPILFQKNTYANASAKLRRDITSPIKTKKFPYIAGNGLYVGDVTYDTLMSHIYTSDLRKNKSYAYSCLNFCLLMNMEQNITGIRHDKWVRDSIFAPIGAKITGYRPLDRFTVNDIAATEYDPFIRKATVCGYTHDELACMSGGVQGNAGLFSNAGDLAKLCQMWLNGGVYGDRRVLSEETVKLFTTQKSPTCRRGLGFDKPNKENEDLSPTCPSATAATFGHTGFTGTCFWVDPDNQLIYIFLGNRVNPTRDNVEYRKLNVTSDLFTEIYNSLK